MGVALLTALVLLTGACSSGDDDAALSLDDLRGAGDECPVDLAGSALVADQVGEIEVEVTEGSGEGDVGDPAIDRTVGVHVECRTGGDGGTLAVVYASEEPGALAMLLPLALRDLDLASDDADVLLSAYDDTGAGDLVELSEEGPVAIAKIDVDGAESAVLYLSTNGATPDEVADATRAMLDAL